MFASFKLLTLSFTFLASILFGHAPGPTPTFQKYEGLVSLDAARALPTHGTSIALRGYPGSKLHFGAFTSQKQWDGFARHFKAKAPVALDWTKQAVAYVVLDAQTNALGNVRASRNKSSTTIHFDWDGIEPFYADSTPAVLLVIDRAGVTDLAFRHGPGAAGLVGAVKL